MVNRSPHSLTQAATRSLLLSAVLMLPFAAQAGLPKYAFSVPPGQSAADGMQAAEQCGLKGKSLVLPALTFHIAGDENPDNSFQDQARSLLSIADDAEVFLHITVGAGRLTGGETERQITDRVAAFIRRVPLMSPAVHGIIIDLEDPANASDLIAFSLRDLVVAAKGAKSELRLAFATPAGFIDGHSDTVKRVATYFDLLGIPYAPGWETQAKWIAEQALNKPILLKVSPAQPTSYLAASLAATGTTVQIVWSDPPDQKALDGLCAVNTFVTRYITDDKNPPASGASPFSILVDGVGAVAEKWFSGGRSADTVVLARVNGTPGRPRILSVHGVSGNGVSGTIEVQFYDGLSGARLPTSQTAEYQSEYALVVIHGADAGERTRNAVEVKGEADLKVEEVIARWQQYQAAQRQRLNNYMADVLMNLHFEGTSFVPAFDINLKFKQFVTHDNLIEWQQIESYVNGVKFGNREFPLPSLDPTKVVTQPLELALNEKYEYKLIGTEKVDGILCYVISVEPKLSGEILFSGKIWIDATTFRQVKQYLRQRGEKSNVASNVETQNFALVSDGKGNQFNLVKSITAQQLLNAGGRDLVLQKTYEFSEYTINNEAFDQRLTSAHNSPDPMFRDTDTGLRGLLKKGDERVLDTSTSKEVKSIVVGGFYEGTFSFPIPIAGISIADFNYRNTGAQLSVFFAGPILATNISKQYGKKFRLGADLALSGIPGNNRLYSGSTELTGQSIYTWEEDAGVRATWIATTSLSLTASGYLSYEYYHRTSQTDTTYVLPRDGVTLLPSAELKYSRRGYVFSAQGTRGQRLGWTAFGYPAQPQALHSTFNRYYADLAKTYYLPHFTRLGWDFSYFGGDNLDRISRYWPSFFSVPQLHGIPGGTDSFDAIAMGHVSYGFNVLDFLKIEGLYAYARARDLEESRQFKEFDGVELNFGTAGPWGTYMQGTVSYALDGNIDRYNSRWGVLFMMFKPLR
jgi:hypothetical protein